MNTRNTKPPGEIINPTGSAVYPIITCTNSGSRIVVP
jgi:hypothetical protein